MKLYLKIPGSKRVGWKARNRLVTKFVLKDTEATEVPQKDALELLNQNPHLVSETPLEVKEADIKKKDQLDSENVSTPEDQDRKPTVLDVVKTISASDIDNTKIQQLRAWAKDLGIVFDATTKKASLIKSINSRCTEVVEEL